MSMFRHLPSRNIAEYLHVYCVYFGKIHIIFNKLENKEINVREATVSGV